MSAASKFLHLGTAVLFRGRGAPSPATSLLFPKPISSLKSLRLFPSYCSSATVDTVVHAAITAEAPPDHHPWPEWVAFIDRLRAKGYFAKTLSEEQSEIVYKDMNLLKDACLSFARDRYDVFKSLSTKDIEVLVGGGCPNLLRKAVNSAKRLRSFVKLDEGDVCSTCNLRGSCDRSYVILREYEADARTVDIVRILLFYALDPVVSASGKPIGRELVESSARKLLSELLELSDTSPDPALPKPAARVPKKMEKTLAVAHDEMSQNVEMKRGDWICQRCNYMNFSKNIRCLKCKEEGPKGVGATEVVMKKGDWTCPKCNFMNFSRNICCLKCKAEGPKNIGVEEIELKKGDWNCPRCQFMNFARNKRCFRCQESRPSRLLNPGEWECPSCDFLNYRRNMACLKCNCERPREAATNEYEELWRQPH